MNDAAPRGDVAPPDAPGADSAGLGWSGRELTSTGFDGDLGAGDPDLLAALDDPQDETGLMRAIAHARLLVPIVAVPRGVDGPGEPMAGRSTDMAVVTLTSSVGQRAFLGSCGMNVGHRTGLRGGFSL